MIKMSEYNQIMYSKIISDKKTDEVEAEYIES